MIRSFTSALAFGAIAACSVPAQADVFDEQASGTAVIVRACERAVNIAALDGGSHDRGRELAIIIKSEGMTEKNPAAANIMATCAGYLAGKAAMELRVQGFKDEAREWKQLYESKQNNEKIMARMTGSPATDDSDRAH